LVQQECLIYQTKYSVYPTKTMAEQKNAHVYKHSDGRIYARIRWIDADGNRQERKYRAESVNGAKRILRKKLEELDTPGADLRDECRTFAQAAAEYEKIELVPAQYVDGHKVLGKKSTYTPKKILAMLVAHFGLMPIQSITRPDIEEFRRIRFATPVILHNKKGKVVVRRERSIRSVNYDLQVLRAVFYFAEAKDWLRASPQKLFRKLILTSQERKRDRLLTPDEQSRLIAACSGPREHIRPIVIAALDTSLRRGSLLALTWADVDFGKRLLHGRKMKTETQVTIAMTRRLELELRQLYELSDRRPGSLVFGVGDFKKAWQGALKEADIRDLRFHDLRAAAATEMLWAGVPEEIVRKATGHARAAMLRDHYTRQDELTAHRIVEMVERARAEHEAIESKLIN
jgi:integrase